MIPRRIAAVVRSRLADYPAVALVGPRQCGKTTLARQFGGRYFDLEQEPDRLSLDLQWPDLAAGRELVVLDEAQDWPAVFPRLRGAIDAERGRSGRFLILGSVSPDLMTRVSESLAGRLAIVELSPLSLRELPTKAAQDRTWLCGGYPEGGVLTPHRYPRWQHDYLRLLTARDLPNWGLPTRPQETGRLLKMLAAQHGQTWNASRLGQSLGVSYHTVNRYLDYLEGAFLVRRLPPYHANIGKRLVKTPKVYWRDTGLLHALMNVSDTKELLVQPWVGASWEGFVVEQIITMLRQCDVPFEPYFLRTSDQFELDLLLVLGSERWAFEVKLTASPSIHDMDRLARLAGMVGATRCFLVSQVRETIETGQRISCNLPWLLAHVEEQLAQ
ncbi:MAG: ATP-binding protein [Thermoguttaceae bacterium]|jgi:predicted AAA+ superfamily ATPase|nr:ATP-binding protein [Thermoguttaceae bacterium]